MNPEALQTDPDAPPSSRHDPRPGAGRLAFDALAPERAALEPGRVRHPHVDVLAAAATVLGALDGLRALRGELVEKLPAFPIEHLDRLEVRAHAAAHAQLESMAPETDRPALRATVREALGLRRVLRTAARALAERGLLDAERVEATWTGRGHMHLAVQLDALAGLLIDGWSEIAQRTAVSREQIDRAAVLALELARLLGARQPVGGSRPRGRSLAPAAAERDRAFSLLYEDYAAVRLAIGFLRHAQGDADWVAPSMGWARDRRPARGRPAVRSWVPRGGSEVEMEARQPNATPGTVPLRRRFEPKTGRPAVVGTERVTGRADLPARAHSPLELLEPFLDLVGVDVGEVDGIDVGGHVFGDGRRGTSPPGYSRQEP